MAEYRIVSTHQVPVTEPTTRAHITHVRIGSNIPDNTFTLERILKALSDGEIFYTIGPTTGTRAGVIPYTCLGCLKTHIKTLSDTTKDNNLDNLPRF